MSNRAKTSVENLAELIRLTNKEVYADLFGEIQKIKAMHREEIDDAYWLGYGDQLGHLTDAPILSQDYFVNDDGTINQDGKGYYYPHYQLKSFLDDLVCKGVTYFHPIHEEKHA